MFRTFLESENQHILALAQDFIKTYDLNTGNILADALEDSGETELAEMFRTWLTGESLDLNRSDARRNIRLLPPDTIQQKTKGKWRNVKVKDLPLRNLIISIIDSTDQPHNSNWQSHQIHAHFWMYLSALNRMLPPGYEGMSATKALETRRIIKKFEKFVMDNIEIVARFDIMSMSNAFAELQDRYDQLDVDFWNDIERIRYAILGQRYGV
jgi:hypothetical protein